MYQYFFINDSSLINDLNKLYRLIQYNIIIIIICQYFPPMQFSFTHSLSSSTKQLLILQISVRTFIFLPNLSTLQARTRQNITYKQNTIGKKRIAYTYDYRDWCYHFYRAHKMYQVLPWVCIGRLKKIREVGNTSKNAYRAGIVGILSISFIN